MHPSHIASCFEILCYVAVDDSGFPINPMIVRGQVQGGVALGISNACFEESGYREDGQQSSTFLVDYLIASSTDLPAIEIVEYNVHSPHTPLGSKGKGEGLTGMGPGMLGNAIEDALTPLGVRTNEMPFTAERIWSLIRGAGAGAARA